MLLKNQFKKVKRLIFKNKKKYYFTTKTVFLRKYINVFKIINCKN